jgi:hypothetical protein
MLENLKNLNVQEKKEKNLSLSAGVEREGIEYLIRFAKGAKECNEFQKFKDYVEACTEELLQKAIFVLDRISYSDNEKFNDLLSAIYYLGKNTSIRDVEVMVHDSSSNNAHNGYKDVRCSLVPGQNPVRYLTIAETLEARENILKLLDASFNLYNCWFEKKAIISGIFLNRDYESWDGDYRYLEEGVYKASTLFFDNHYTMVRIDYQTDIFSPIKLRLNVDGTLYGKNRDIQNTIEIKDLCKYKNVKIEIELDEILLKNGNITLKNRNGD